MAFDKNVVYKNDNQYINHLWRGYNSTKMSPIQTTGVDRQEIQEVAEKLFNIPENFKPHKLIKNNYEKRLENLSNNTVDWATAEALSFGTLIKENYRVRLSGQDIKRGTFSHRHACIWDQENGKEICNYYNLQPKDKD